MHGTKRGHCASKNKTKQRKHTRGKRVGDFQPDLQSPVVQSIIFCFSVSFEAKRNRRQAERKWRASGVVVHKELWYKNTEHYVTKIGVKANSLFYHCKTPAASSTKKLFTITVSSLRQTHLPDSFFFFFFLPLPYLPEAFSNVFIDKFVNVRRKHDSQSVCPISLSI